MNVTTRQALVEKVKDDGVLSSSSYGTVEVKMFVSFVITTLSILIAHILHSRRMHYVALPPKLRSIWVLPIGIY